MYCIYRYGDINNWNMEYNGHEPRKLDKMEMKCTKLNVLRLGELW